MYCTIHTAACEGCSQGADPKGREGGKDEEIMYIGFFGEINQLIAYQKTIYIYILLCGRSEMSQ